MTDEFIRQSISYDKDTGDLYWITANGNRKTGDKAGSLDAYGYIQVCIGKKKYKAHRVAWFLFYGKWPNKELDHIDGDKQNNRIVNLRDVTTQLNQWNNTKAQCNNAIGMRGVVKHRNKFMADINVSGKKIYLGLFDTPQLAHQAYLQAKQKHHAIEAKLKEKNEQK